jgi:hypothetical protein
MFVIKSIDDDDGVRLKALDSSGAEVGQLIKTKPELLMSKYELNQKAGVAAFAAYPEKDIAHLATTIEDLSTKAFLNFLVLEFYKLHAPCNVRLQDKPTKQVIVTKKFPKHALVIPVCGDVACVSTRKELPQRCFEFKNVPNTEMIWYIKPRTYVEGTLQPCSYLSTCKNAADSNLDHAWFTTSVVFKQFKFDRFSKTKIPAIHNIVPVNASDVIQLYVAPIVQESTEKRQSILFEARPSKKPKKI